MRYVGVLWPKEEEGVLASGKVSIFGTQRKSSRLAVNDAKKLYKTLSEGDATTGMYVASIDKDRVVELICLEDAPSDGPQWKDRAYVRTSIDARHADAYAAAGGAVTWTGDGTAYVDFAVTDASDAADLIEALRTENPAGIPARVLEVLDRLRGQKSRYEAAQELRKDLAKIPPPASVKQEQDRKAKLSKKRRQSVEEILSKIGRGQTTIKDLEREILDIEAKPKRTDADRDRQSTLKTAVRKYGDAVEIVGESNDCDAPEPQKPAKVAWFDGSDAPILRGKATTVYIPSGEGSPDELAAEYVLVPEKRLGTSHDPWTFAPTKGYDASLQERDYATAQQEQSKVIFGAQWFEPAFVINSTPSAVDGPPIIGGDGHVLGGNGRGMMIRRTMRENTRYEDALTARLYDHAGVFGLSPAQAKGHVLVRKITGKYDANDISARLNAAFTQSIDDHAGAVSMGKRLPSDLLRILAREISEDTLSAAIQKTSPTLVRILQREQIITPYNTSEWLMHKGGKVLDALSAKGRDKLRAALLGAVVDDKTLLAHMESAGLRDLVERIAPVLLGVEQLDTKWRDRYTMMKPLRKALVVLADTITLSDGAFTDHFTNLSLFEGGADASIADEITQDGEAVAWLLWLRNAAKGSRVSAQRKAFDAWRSLPSFVTTSDEDLFGGNDAPSRARWFVAWGLDDPEAVDAAGGRAWIAGDRTPRPKPPAPKAPDTTSEETKEAATPQASVVDNKEKGEDDFYHGFLDGMSRLQAGRVKKILDRPMRIDDVTRARAEHIQHWLDKRELVVSAYTQPLSEEKEREIRKRVNAIVFKEGSPSRKESEWRARYAELFEEAKKKEVAKTTEYHVGYGMVHWHMPKTAYDYAAYLLDKYADTLPDRETILQNARPKTFAEREKDKAEAGEQPAAGGVSGDDGTVLFHAPTEAIVDVGEKIGGARKDTAIKTGPKAEILTSDERPAWRKRYVVMKATGSGRWNIADLRKKDAFGGPRIVGPRAGFDTEAEAEEHVPVIELARNHKWDRYANGKWGVFRRIVNRNYVPAVALQFESRIEAMRYSVKNAVDIIETRVSFGERDLFVLVNKFRRGPDRRDNNRNVSADEVLETFGLRAIEFGKWNSQNERQLILNDTYDALRDLCKALGITTRSIGLGGDLALAFGARGRAGAGAAIAHYEPTKITINLTKEWGAGTLAHEWCHALDHYLCRILGKTTSEWTQLPDGTRALGIAEGEPVFLSQTFALLSDHPVARAMNELDDAMLFRELSREELREEKRVIEEALESTIASWKSSLEQRTKQIEKYIDELREVMQGERKLGRRKPKPATDEQIAKFESLAAEIFASLFAKAGRSDFRQIHIYKNRGPYKEYARTRYTNDILEELSEVLSEHTGNSGILASGHGYIGRLSTYWRWAQEDRDRIEAETKGGYPDRALVTRRNTDFVLAARELDLGRGEPYWNTPQERLARAFQAYVQEEFHAKSMVNTFLNHVPERVAIKTPGGDRYPYPEGEERLVIGRAFRKFIRTLDSLTDNRFRLTVTQQDDDDAISVDIADDRYIDVYAKDASDLNEWWPQRIRHHEERTNELDSLGYFRSRMPLRKWGAQQKAGLYYLTYQNLKREIKRRRANSTEDEMMVLEIRRQFPFLVDKEGEVMDPDSLLPVEFREKMKGKAQGRDLKAEAALEDEAVMYDQNWSSRYGR